jgi:hypothetical protein
MSEEQRIADMNSSLTFSVSIEILLSFIANDHEGGVQCLLLNAGEV